MEPKAKILLVDDDPDIIEAMCAVLHEYALITARDGLEGLAKLRSEKPDLMILDLMMPRMDGFAVCEELQDPRWAKYSNIPIIILTSVREGAGRRRYELGTGLQLRVNDYIEKPIDPPTLLMRVKTYLRKNG
ncbi:Response regulator receiver protein [Syntrophobacter sp. SbD1]|nr:Response regulator receiver protein [Syntrophobacter sp. SbD1]